MQLTVPYRLSLSGLLCLLLGNFFAVAQSPVLPSPKIFQATEYYEAQGLISNIVYDINQDADGLLWLLTNKGVVTFDGLNWTPFSDQLQLPNTKYSVIERLQTGMLVVGEYGREIRLGLYKNAKWQFITTPKLNQDYRDLRISVHEENTSVSIALASKDSLYILRNTSKKWQQFALPNSLGYEIKIRDIQWFQDNLWLATDQGLWTFSYKAPSFQKFPLPKNLSQKLLLLNALPNKTGFFLLADNWLGKFNKGNIEVITTDIYRNSPIKNSRITHATLLIDQSQNIIFSHNYALNQLDPQDEKSLFAFQLKDGKSLDGYTASFQDKEGNYWFATERGIKKVSTLGIANYNHSNGLPEDEISVILPLDNQQTLIAGNYSIALIDSSGLETIRYSGAQEYIGEVRVLDACKTSNGSLFLAANRNGIGHLLGSGEIVWQQLPAGMVATAVFPAPTATAGVWVGTDRGKIFYYLPGKPLKEVLSLGPDYIRKIRTSTSGITYILRNNGLTLVSAEGQIIKELRSSDPLYNLYSILELDDRILLGSANGIAQYKDGKITPWEDGPVCNRPVYAMQQIGNALWFGTDNGIYAWGGHHLHHLTLDDGLMGQEINRAAFSALANGQLWVGTDRGLSVINPKLFSLYSQQPSTSLTSLTAGKHKWVHPHQAIEMPEASSSIEFGFNSINLHRPASLHYRYRLSGLESGWNEITNPYQTSVRYAHLPPGDYQFELQSRAYNTPWGKVVKSGKIHVDPPIYQSPAFILSACLITAFLTYLIFTTLLTRRTAEKLEIAIQKKRAEIAVTEERFQRLWEAADMCMALVQTNGQILMANPSLQRLANSKHLNGKRLDILIPSIRLTEKELREVVMNGTIVREEISLPINNQSRHFLLTLSPIFQSDESRVLVMLKEVSELKVIQEENLQLTRRLLEQNQDLRKKEEALRKNNEKLLVQRTELQSTLKNLEERNFELDQLVYKTSHDLRAPISSALGLLNIMKLENDPDQHQHYIDLAVQALHKQDTFIKSMLSFSRATRSQNPVNAIDFREIIHHCLEDLQFLPGFNEVTIKQEILHEHTPFAGDPQKLHIIFANLLSNSLKYRDPNKEGEISIFISLNKEEAQVHLIDNGLGIGAEYLPRIFDMFYRATENSTGSGLGLYIVRQTIEKMQGTIQVSSELGKGTEFIIRLPNFIKKLTLPGPFKEKA